MLPIRTEFEDDRGTNAQPNVVSTPVGQAESATQNGERRVRPKAGSTLLETARGRQIPDDERIAPGIAHQLHRSLHRRGVISGNGNCHFVSLPTGSALDGAGIGRTEGLHQPSAR